jgi:predicted small integral membrane protein
MKRFDFLAVLLAFAATITQLPASVVTWQELLNKTQPVEGLLDSPETFADRLYRRKACAFSPT